MVVIDFDSIWVLGLCLFLFKFFFLWVFMILMNVAWVYWFVASWIDLGLLVGIDFVIWCQKLIMKLNELPHSAYQKILPFNFWHCFRTWFGSGWFFKALQASWVYGSCLVSATIWRSDGMSIFWSPLWELHIVVYLGVDYRHVHPNYCYNRMIRIKS